MISRENSRLVNEWWAIYTRHQHEKTIAKHFLENGFEPFLPVYGTVKQWKDRKKRLVLPLFPCYLFLRGDWERRVEILSAPGVCSIVSVAGRPAPVAESEILALKQVMQSSAAAEPHPYLSEGNWVRIKSGPLANIEGILVRKKSSYRLILSAELLQKSIAIEIDAWDVEPLIDRKHGRTTLQLPAQARVENLLGTWQNTVRRSYLERLP